MQRHVAFLRAVMQGRDGLTREVLVEATAEAGGREVATHQSTGNVSFTNDDPEGVAAALSRTATTVLGRETPVFVRALAHLAGWLAGDPFAGADPDAAERLLILAAYPLEGVVGRIDWPADITVVGVGGADAWFTRARAEGPHPHRVLERADGRPATARSIGTIELIVRANESRHRS